jgi:glutathione synthase/RimK-type ligase-like ATP-grasp enzyme
MKLLKITDSENKELDEPFEETETINVEDVAPEVIDGKTNVRLNGHSVGDYDAAFLEIPAKNPVFGRVLLEMIEEKGVKTVYPSIGFYIMAKKNYLYYVLNQKEVETPSTVIIASEKATRNIDRELEYPMIAKKYEDMSLSETKKIDDHDEIREFVEGTEYGEDILIFQEYHEGDKYKCFYANDQIISLKDKTDGWRVREENLQYSTLSSDMKEQIRKAMRGIGTDYGEIIIQGEKIININPNPDPEIYTDVSGKNAFEMIANVLKTEED